MLKIISLVATICITAFSCALCGMGGTSHVGVSTNTIFAKDTVQKIETVWKFDDFLSAELLSVYDKNKNKIFDQNEIKDMFAVLSKLEKPPFMTVVSINNTEIKNFKIANFTVYVKDKTVYISFDIALDVQIKDKSVLAFYFFDSTQYLSFFHTTENIKFQNSTGYKIQKNFGLKILQNTMSIANIITYEVKK